MTEFYSQLKEYFPGVIRTAAELPPVEIIETPWPALNNVVLGCGGIPKGRSIELYGPPSAGKTTIALNFVALYQDLGLSTAWDDREGTLPGPDYTDTIGIDRERLFMVDSSDGNDAVYQALLMMALDAMDLYVIDSLAAVMPREASTVSKDADLSMRQRLSRASLLTAFFSQLRSGYEIAPPTAKPLKSGGYSKKDLIKADKIYQRDGQDLNTLHKLTDKHAALICINHMKVKPGQKYGDAATTPGGEATKFDASIRLRVTYKKKSKQKNSNGSPLYKIVELRADKNKVAPPFGKALFKLNIDGRLESFDGKLKNGSDDDLEDITAEDVE